MFSTMLQAETTPCPLDGWRPAGAFSPTLYIRVADCEAEIIGAFKVADGEYGVAHGRIRFNWCVDSTYMRCIAQDTFDREVYWRRCLLPQRFRSQNEAVEYLCKMIGV